MISADNILYLKNKFPNGWKQLQNVITQSNDVSYEVLPSKSGQPTLSVEYQGKSIFLHSKYNPIEEGIQFIQQFKDVHDYKHVFFYGIGLGYHVEAFLNENPGMPFTLYEPEPRIFEAFLSRVTLAKLPAPCKSLFLETDDAHAEAFLKNYVQNLNEDVLLVQLPSYDRVFPEKGRRFADLFKELLKQKKSSLQVNLSYEKRWIYNSLVNLEYTIKTPNIMLEMKEKFKDKPIIMVAAGPSLQDEIENLKYIKENGLAYIFSVGTSINALIANGIHPDAACTYDPTQMNQKVFEKVNELEITTIPLIYGSSVGFEVLKYYAGPKLHMLTNQDTIAEYYLRTKDNQPIDRVHDASTISVIALQLIHKLQSNLVIMVGQNLAFRGNQLYSSGALVIRQGTEVLESDRKNVVIIESVHGDQIESNRDYLLMKTHIEECLKHRPGLEVINTTQGGAKIEHTTFMSLEEVIKGRLSDRVVNPDWYKSSESSYDIVFAQKRAVEMKEEYELLIKYFHQVTAIFNDMNRCKEHRDKNRLGKIFVKFDKQFMKIQSNRFFITFIKPMNRVQEELLMKNIESIKFQNDFIEKADLIIQNFGKYLYGCQVSTTGIKEIFEAIQNYILRLNPSE